MLEINVSESFKLQIFQGGGVGGRRNMPLNPWLGQHGQALDLQQATLSTAYSVHIIHLLHFLMTTWDSFTEISAIADRYMKWPENTKAAG